MFDPKKQAPLILGILNVTPDSFSDGSAEALSIPYAVSRAKQLMHDGADALDIGGESTRPGATPVATEEELQRVIPVVTALRAQVPDAFLSIDTRNPEVAQQALHAGAHALNIHGGLQDREKSQEANSAFESLLREYRCPIAVYHTEFVKGLSPQEVFQRIMVFFNRQEVIAQELDIPIALDPGFGWKHASRIAYVFEHLEALQAGRTLLIGVSRKRHLGTLLKHTLWLESVPGTHERMEAGLAAAAVAVLRGARIIRTHDVASTKKFFSIFNLLLNRGPHERT